MNYNNKRHMLLLLVMLHNCLLYTVIAYITVTLPSAENPTFIIKQFYYKTIYLRTGTPYQLSTDVFMDHIMISCHIIIKLEVKNIQRFERYSNV